jgi:hypothetical protein
MWYTESAMETYAALCEAGVERVTASELRKPGLSVEDAGFREAVLFILRV